MDLCTQRTVHSEPDLARRGQEKQRSQDAGLAPSNCGRDSSVSPIEWLETHQLQQFRPVGPDQASGPTFNRICNTFIVEGKFDNALVNIVYRLSRDGGKPSKRFHSLLQPYSKEEGLEDHANQLAPFGAQIRDRPDFIDICDNPWDGTLDGSAPSSFCLVQTIPRHINVSSDDMTTIASAPDSPPDLSGSRSSKSSTSTSPSQFSGPDGILSDVSNFEEIGLDDEKSSPYKHAFAVDRTNGAQTPIVTRTSPKKGNDSPVTAAREIGVVKRPTFPGLQGHVRSATSYTIRQDGRYPGVDFDARRGLTSPSVPILPIADDRARPRSSSPVHRISTSGVSATFPTSNLRPLPISPRNSLTPLPPRRGSWQPNRKSIQELEAEYNDSDDDLPDDASLWNVPMSPRPPEERHITPRSSNRGSPDRDGPSHSPRPIPLAHAITAPETPPAKGLFSQSMPKGRPMVPRSATLHSASLSLSTPSSPNSRKSMRAIRAKSWTLAMSELSEEAKILSEALEFHAENLEREQENRVQTGRNSNVEGSRSARSSAIQLPPVQKGSLDFMPISKEKEAILSRTRPPWLPPKDPREEKRHLKEYQRMMAASIEAEKRKESQLQLQRCQKDDSRETLNKIWEHYVSAIPKVNTDHNLRELSWRGVSPRVRGRVWERATGNQLALTAKSYERARQRANDIMARKLEDLSDTEKMMLNWFRDIERDAETAFPELNLFQRNGPLWHDLVNICEAYACYRSDVGYLYGVQLISALLLLQLPSPSSVFILLANCLNRPMPLAFLTNDPGSTSRTYGLAISTLAIKFPHLHSYLFGSEERGGLCMSGESIFEPMFRTLFSNGLDADRLSRVWDCWMFEGDRTLVQTAVAILGCLQNQIFDLDGHIDLKRRNIQEMLGWGPFGRKNGNWDLEAVGDQDRFMDEVREAGKLDYTGR